MRKLLRIKAKSLQVKMAIWKDPGEKTTNMSHQSFKYSLVKAMPTVSIKTQEISNNLPSFTQLKTKGKNV